MTAKTRAITEVVAQVLLLAGSAVLLGALLYHHYQLIGFAVPLDYNEAGMLSVTASIAEGINPYTFENQPMRSVVYPVLYNIVVAPLSSIFGNSLVLHRTVAGLFILLSCSICYLVIRRQGNSQLESLAASALWYTVLLYYSTPIASPNSLGVLLFFASISIPWLYHFSNRSLCVAMVFGILAFYGKQYLIACLGYIALYLFIAVSKQRALLFGVTSLALFLITLGVVHLTSPFFFDNAIFAVKYVAASVTSYETAFRQLSAFAQIYLPLLVILVLQFAKSLIGKKAAANRKATSIHAQGKAEALNLTDLNAPLLNTNINYFWFCFASSLLVIVLFIGKNPANHLTYLFQILSPFLLIACFRIVANSGGLKPLYYCLIIATFYSNYSILSHDFSVDTANWDKLNKLVSGADNIYASTLAIPDVIHAGKEVYDNGHTRYFYHAEEKPPIFAHAKPEQDITQIWDLHVKRINAMIEAQEFDLILLDNWMLLPMPSPRSNITDNTQVSLQKHYYLSDTFMLKLAERPGGGSYLMNVWKPKLQTHTDQEEPIYE